MSGISDLPVCVCPFPDCGAVWIHDDQMYEDMDICPRCGRVATPPWEGIRDPLESMVSNSGGAQTEILYTQTAGPLLVRALASLPDFTRVRGY